MVAREIERERAVLALQFPHQLSEVSAVAAAVMKAQQRLASTRDGNLVGKGRDTRVIHVGRHALYAEIFFGHWGAPQ